MQYAGAFSKIIIANQNSLNVVLSTKNPIGIYPVEISFENIIIQLKQKDKIYFFSDGYFDQFGGKNGKKFSFKAFKDIMENICNEKMEVQRKVLQETFDKWVGNEEQCDDVLILGIEI